jgi:hypothetical protein
MFPDAYVLTARWCCAATRRWVNASAFSALARTGLDLRAKNQLMELDAF